jgi:membrane-associated phospholipid phosphatase
MTDLLWEWIPWGYRALLEIETWRTPAMDTLFPAISALGDERFNIILLCVLYWCIGKHVGLGVGYAFLCSSYANSSIKGLFAIPRPGDPALSQTLSSANITQTVTPILLEPSSPSWPSGHSQGAIVTWGYLAQRVQKGWFWIAAGLLAAMIAFSRVYGGVHCPQDIVGGVLIGLVFLVLWLRFEPWAQTLFAGRPLAATLGFAMAIGLVGLLLNPSSDGAMVVGAAVGLTVGGALEKRVLRFSPGGAWWRRAVRGLVGLIVVFGAYAGLSALFGLVDSEPPLLGLRALRYALLALVGTLGAPWLFLRVGLAEQEEGMEHGRQD